MSKPDLPKPTEQHRASAEALLTSPLDVALDRVALLLAVMEAGSAPIPMRLNCPGCSELHIDEGEFVAKPHHTHACQECGLVWRPAVVHTVGVRYLPGFKNDGV